MTSETMPQDERNRRREDRFPIPPERLILVTTEDAKHFCCEVENVSAQGMQLRFLTGSGLGALQVDDVIHLEECDRHSQLCGINPAAVEQRLATQGEACCDAGEQAGRGRVAWLTEDLFGIELDTPLPFLSDFIATVLIRRGAIDLAAEAIGSVPPRDDS